MHTASAAPSFFFPFYDSTATVLTTNTEQLLGEMVEDGTTGELEGKIDTLSTSSMLTIDKHPAIQSFRRHNGHLH